MNYIKDIKLKEDYTYNVIIEIPKGINNKYELVEPGFDKVKEVRKVVGKYPFYYGCFPQTYAGDRDPLDMILLSKKKQRGILDIVSCQPIGVIKTIDDGEVDDKVLVIAADETIENLDKLEKKALNFLKRYKGKKHNMILDETIYDVEEAVKIIEQAHKDYKEKFINTNSSNSLSSF